MSKSNIYKNEWLELVFEGKNKAYGAYQLRQEEEKTTLTAFFGVILFLGLLTGGGLLLSSFGEKPEITNVIELPIPITPVNLIPEEVKPEILKTTEQPKTTIPKNETMVVVKKVDAPVVDLPKTQVETPISTNTTNSGTGGVIQTNGGSGGGTVVLPLEIPLDPNKIIGENEVEKNPTYPGGIKEFLKLVGSKFVTPEIEDEKVIKIMVYFVVEKDGSISNITVPRKPGYDLDKEAIRVLKSIKTKWEPGIYKGKTVRTQYSLPIQVELQ